MKYQVGDLLANVQRGIIVHGCNAQGVMGGGIALQVRNIYPKAYEGYLRMLKMHKNAGCESCLGSISFVRVADELYIANAITQDFYGTDKRHVNYEAIARAFELVRYESDKRDNLPIHYPLIGAGLAGGNWNIIKVIIDETLSGYDHTCWTLK